MVSGNGPTDPNLPPQGGPIDPNNFNQPGDSPIAYIMTPLVWPQRDENAQRWPQDFRYPEKLKRLLQLIGQLIPGIQLPTPRGYAALNYDIPAEHAQRNTNERGLAFFQYDPDNGGSKSWRLFYQQVVKQANV